MITKKSFLIVLAFVMAVSYLFAEEKINLKLNLEKGQTYKMKTVTDMKIKQTIPGQQQPVKVDQRTESKDIYTVEDVKTDGTVVLKVTYDGLFSKTESPNTAESFEYNSANPSASVGPVAPIFNAIVGQSYTVTVTPEGHVKDIQDADALFEGIQEGINKVSGSQMSTSVGASLKAEYGEEALKSNMENLFDMYPDDPVSVGDTWQERTSRTQGFPMSVNSIYTLKDRKDGVAVIDVFALIQPNREAGSVQVGNMNLLYNVSGSVTGLMEIQESTGWVVRSNSTLRLSGAATVQSPEMQQPMTIPLSITGTIVQGPY